MPLLPPDLAAYLATIGEHVFSVLLLVGLASRLSALRLFGMTMVIQLFVFPDGWPEHILWIAPQLLIISRGPGAISLDHLIWTRAPRMLIATRQWSPSGVRSAHTNLPWPGVVPAISIEGGRASKNGPVACVQRDAGCAGLQDVLERRV